MKTKYILFTIILSFVLSLKGWGQGYTISNTPPYCVVYGNKLSDDLTITANFTGTGTIEDPDGNKDNINTTDKSNVVTNNNIISYGILSCFFLSHNTSG